MTRKEAIQVLTAMAVDLTGALAVAEGQAANAIREQGGLAMTINEFLQKYRRVEYGLNVTRPRVRCADGYTVSVQAGYGLYSKPMRDADTYDAVELGYPSSVDSALVPFAENTQSPFTSDVFGYVPVNVVDRLLQAHGGIVSADYSNDFEGKWRSYHDD